MSRQQRIHDALSAELKPSTLTIENESNQHNVPANSETHFKIVAVSTCFNTLPRVSRHRLINNVLAAEWASDLHALSLHLYTPEEWSKKQTAVLASPKCRNARKNQS